MKHHIDMPVLDARETLKSAHSGEKTRKTIIYIAGPMTGLKSANRPVFAEAAETLRSMGYVVLNPAVLPTGMPRERYMPICLAMLEQADIICMLPGWDTSRGAQLEIRYAKYQDKAVCGYNWLIGKEDALE